MLGARVVAPCNLDTDQFGSLDGTFARELGVRANAQAKACTGVHPGQPVAEVRAE